jgi:hypothetical protein
MCSGQKYLVQSQIIRCFPDVAVGAPNRPGAGAERAFLRSRNNSKHLTISDCQVGFPIRTSRDQRVLSPPPGLSQSATSFIASCCQGIHQTPLSRLIRSRRRRALLCDGGSNHQPVPGLDAEVSTRSGPSARGPPGSASPERPEGQTELTVSVFDLERLSLVVLPLRWSRTSIPKPPGGAPRPFPTRNGPKNVSCFCSLHDVST